jgi:F-type H+-transporting ATPase subunit delta
VAGEASILSGLAGRYATALFELALEAHAVDAVEADVKRFDGLLTESTDLARLVRSPLFSAEEQSKALAAVLERAGIGGLTARFFMVVTANRRLFAIRDIIKAYASLAARHRGEIAAEVTVAEPLSQAHAAEIESTLHAITGKTVRVAMRIDRSIIGGLIVKLGSRMVDTSLRGKLNALKHVMKEVG